MMSTFTDSGQTLEDFSETIYVHCPKCSKRAYVKRIDSDEDKFLSDIPGTYRRIARKLSCLYCAYVMKVRGGLDSNGRNFPSDPFYALPLSLWLQTPCCGNILWAYNEEHLSYLERFVTAKQREKFHVTGRIRNATMASRLPLWIKSAHNRAELLKGIDRLKCMLDEQ